MRKNLYGSIVWERALYTEGCIYVLSIDIPPVVLVVKGKWNPNSFETLHTCTDEISAVRFAEKYFEKDYYLDKELTRKLSDVKLKLEESK